MGTEILLPQDCLIERSRISPCRRRNYYYGSPSFSASKSSTPKSNNPNARFNRKPAVRAERPDHQRKRSTEQSIPKRSSSADDLKVSRSQSLPHGNNKSNSPMMEKVTILRRGESLDSNIKSSETTAAAWRKKQAGSAGASVSVTGTDWLGAGSGMVSKPVRIVDRRSPMVGNCEVYAGSACSVSPAPSSLPLPSFSKKKQVCVDDFATRDLKRLLQLEF